jgi:very-short-patch-repair endonuclease
MTKRKTNLEFIEEIKVLTNDEYIFTEEYIDTSTKIECQHKTCGNKWKVTPRNFLSCNVRCPKCRILSNANKRRKDNEYFNSRIPEIDREFYILKSNYIDNRKKVKIFHTVCNNEYEVSPENFYAGKRCPICAHTRNSKGMQKIRNFLTDNNILFDEEKKFDDCKNIRPLPFDFFLKDYNTIIEFDGQHHFTSIPAWGGHERLKTTQINDCIKNKYCEDNKIILIRIPFNKLNNIEEILSSYKRSSSALFEILSGLSQIRFQP